VESRVGDRPGFAHRWSLRIGVVEHRTRPVVGAVVRVGELSEREDLPDTLTERVHEDVHLRHSTGVTVLVATRPLNAADSVLPLVAGKLELHSCSTAGVRPKSWQLGEHAIAKLVAGPRKGEGSMGVQALEAAATRRAADPGVELRPKPPLLRLGSFETLRQHGVGCNRSRPALDAARSLEPGDCGDELRARDVELRRERMAFGIERSLLGHRRPAERAANRHALERARRAADLTGYNLYVGHERER
jgi:hypothetical protein